MKIDLNDTPAEPVSNAKFKIISMKSPSPKMRSKSNSAKLLKP